MTHKIHISFIATAVFIGLILGAMWFTPQKSLGSVFVTSEYYATSTAANTTVGSFTSSRIIKAGAGAVLGSLVITGANTGRMNFYDATTTDVNLRTGNPATSTILIASFPPNAAAGTYTFDITTKQGLYLDIIGVAATSTITYR